MLAWAASVNVDGLSACEQLAASNPGSFCFGAEPSLADICLVPQLGNARRFKVDVTQFPRLLRAEAAAMGSPPSAMRHPTVRPTRNSCAHQRR